jgi:hypothetical protein
MSEEFVVSAIYRRDIKSIYNFDML